MVGRDCTPESSPLTSSHVLQSSLIRASPGGMGGGVEDCDTLLLKVSPNHDLRLQFLINPQSGFNRPTGLKSAHSTPTKLLEDWPYHSKGPAALLGLGPRQLVTLSS